MVEMKISFLLKHISEANYGFDISSEFING